MLEILPQPTIRSKFCNPGLTKQTITWGWIVMDFIIDIFVTVRLFIILIQANKNSIHVNAQNNLSGGNRIFIAMMKWNVIRVTIAALLNVTTMLDMVNPLGIDPIIVPTLNFIVCSAMSYVITYVSYIVNVIKRDDTIHDDESQTIEIKDVL